MVNKAIYVFLRPGVRDIFTPQSFPYYIWTRNGCSPFDAHLGPGPDIPDGPPGHVLVRGLNKVTYDLLELTQVVGLDSPDLLVTDAPEEVV